MNTFNEGEEVIHKEYTDSRYFVVKQVATRFIRGDELLLVGHFGENKDGQVIQKWKQAADCQHLPRTNPDFVQRPPRGLIQRRFRDESRIEEIADAMGRYKAVRKPIPMEWINEYNEIADRLNAHGDRMY